MKTKAEIYTMPFCNQCRAAIGALKDMEIEYIEYNILFNKTNRQEMARRTNNSGAVPQIFIDGEYIGGWRELLARNLK